MNVRGFAVAAVFLAGCAVGGVSSQLVVPKASAQQAAVTRWEMFCNFVPDPPIVRRSAEEQATAYAANGTKVGSEGWEPIGMVDPNTSTWCFKRPKM